MILRLIPSVVLLSFAWNLIASAQCGAPEQHVQSSDGAADDDFGGKVALSGDVAVITAHDDDDLGKDSGSAYVFRRVGGVWVETQKLVASDGSKNDGFGVSVATDGARIAVGSLRVGVGAVYVFENNGAQWVETQILAPGDLLPGDGFALSLALEGDWLLAGAPFQAFQRGSVYAFQRQAGAFVQVQKIEPVFGKGVANFGNSISLDGSRFAASAPTQGLAILFLDGGGGWIEQVRLTGPDTVPGDGFGDGVSLKGNRLVCGAIMHAHPGTGVRGGAVYVFERIGANWSFQEEIQPPFPTSSGRFGRLLAQDQDRILTGQRISDSVYVFEPGPLTWTMTRILSPSGGRNFGAAFAVDGDQALVGDTTIGNLQGICLAG